eukprot:7385902-Prymnesium_polylepis.3
MWTPAAGGDGGGDGGDGDDRPDPGGDGGGEGSDVPPRAGVAPQIRTCTYSLYASRYSSFTSLSKMSAICVEQPFVAPAD